MLLYLSAVSSDFRTVSSNYQFCDLPHHLVQFWNQELSLQYDLQKMKDKKGIIICKKFGTLHEFACHPCAGAMLIFSVSFQF